MPDSSPANASDGPDSAATASTSASASDDRRGRRVVVPDRVYKTVTVFSTLFAVVAVVGGFVVLDRATNRAQAPVSEIDPLLALVGVAAIFLGAVTYAFSTRFEAEGMGNAKDEPDEPSDNG